MVPDSFKELLRDVRNNFLFALVHAAKIKGWEQQAVRSGVFPAIA